MVVVVSERYCLVTCFMSLILGNTLEPLYGPIRYKLASALTNWHPSDPSAKMILEPWTKVCYEYYLVLK